MKLWPPLYSVAKFPPTSVGRRLHTHLELGWLCCGWTHERNWIPACFFDHLFYWVSKLLLTTKKMHMTRELRLGVVDALVFCVERQGKPYASKWNIDFALVFCKGINVTILVNVKTSTFHKTTGNSRSRLRKSTSLGVSNCIARLQYCVFTHYGIIWSLIWWNHEIRKNKFVVPMLVEKNLKWLKHRK